MRLDIQLLCRHASFAAAAWHALADRA